MCPAKFSRTFSHVSEVGEFGETFWFSVCVPAMPPSVPFVTVLFPIANVVCEVGFSNSDCDFFEPQTPSLSRKKRKVSCMESREYLHIDETLVNAPPTNRRKASVPTPQQSLPPPPDGAKSPSEEITMEVEDQEYCSRGVEYGGEHRWTARDRAVVASIGAVPGHE